MMKRLLQAISRQEPARLDEGIVVVSGLPRSGTSMMMQMLDAGGLETLTDHQRQPDASNPRGYYEFEPVKRLHHGDDTWIDQAFGRAVKVISTQLHHLPPEYNYYVLFMTRSLTEILQSQEAMLRQLGKPLDHFDAARLRREYETHLQAVENWCATHAHIRLHRVDYVGVLQDPQPAIDEIVSFLNLPLDKSAMAHAVDPTLRRQRDGTKSTN